MKDIHLWELFEYEAGELVTLVMTLGSVILNNVSCESLHVLQLLHNMHGMI
jgi:hypothetical protein